MEDATVSVDHPQRFAVVATATIRPKDPLVPDWHAITYWRAVFADRAAGRIAVAAEDEPKTMRPTLTSPSTKTMTRRAPSKGNHQSARLRM